MATLYVVATPIGNREDITLRALRVLQEVGLVAAEDTRKGRHLLSFYHIKTPLTSYHALNKKSKLPYLLNCLQEKDVALISEAGMPGLSDPGCELVAAAAELGIQVVPVPGPSAIVAALAVAGLPCPQFVYLGFPPRKQGKRKQWLKSVAMESRPLIVLEAPHRLQETLKDILEVWGDRRIALCRELTKRYEEIFRGKISEAIAHFSEPRGEFTLVVEGREKEANKPGLTTAGENELRRLQQEGIAPKQAIASISQTTGLSRKELYRIWLRLAPAPDTAANPD